MASRPPGDRKNLPTDEDDDDDWLGDSGAGVGVGEDMLPQWRAAGLAVMRCVERIVSARRLVFDPVTGSKVPLKNNFGILGIAGRRLGTGGNGGNEEVLSVFSVSSVGSIQVGSGKD